MGRPHYRAFVGVWSLRPPTLASAPERIVVADHGLAHGTRGVRVKAISRRTVYHWIETGQLDRELDAEPVRYGPRRRAPSKLDPYKAIIDDRLATYPKLSATRLYWEARESGYDGSCSQVNRYVRDDLLGTPSPPGGQASVS